MSIYSIRPSLNPPVPSLSAREQSLARYNEREGFYVFEKLRILPIDEALSSLTRIAEGDFNFFMAVYHNFPPLSPDQVLPFLTRVAHAAPVEFAKNYEKFPSLTADQFFSLLEIVVSRNPFVFLELYEKFSFLSPDQSLELLRNCAPWTPTTFITEYHQYSSMFDDGQGSEILLDVFLSAPHMFVSHPLLRKKINYDMAFRAVKRIPLILEFIPPEVQIESESKSDEENIILEALKADSGAIRGIPWEFLSQRMVDTAIEKHKYTNRHTGLIQDLKHIAELMGMHPVNPDLAFPLIEFLNDHKTSMITLITRYGVELSDASESLRKDPDVVTAALEKDPSARVHATGMYAIDTDLFF